MRLINVGSLTFEEFEGQNVPRYAILSHRWQEDEVLYADMARAIDAAESKRGWDKIVRCCQQARRDELSYVWIDTCCIDKSSSAELTEAINSMFKWYEESAVCYVYLFDVNAPTIDKMKMRSPGSSSPPRSLSRCFLTQFYGSSWFTRGWTLQELLAPKSIQFFNCDWEGLGDKTELCDALTCATCIPADILLHQRPLGSCTVAQRMSWASKRSTTRMEDLAYSLLGIFNVNMPLLYGEREGAFVRLQEEILRRSNDESILLWQADDLSLLARSPSAFAIHLPVITEDEMYAAEISAKRPLHTELRCKYRKERQPCTMTNVGLSITLLLVPWYIDTYLVQLQVEKRLQVGHRVHSYDACIFLKQTINDSRLARVRIGGEAIRWIEAIGGKSLSQGFLRTTGTIPRPFVIAHDSWDTSAGEGYLHSWDVKKQRYGFKFNISDHYRWGPTKTLEEYDIISRRRWDTRERVVVLDPGGFEVIAVFRLREARRWQYMYFGFTPDFIPTFVQKDWHLPTFVQRNAWHFESSFKSFNQFRNTDRGQQDVSEALSYTHFWESIKRSDPEQELVIHGDPDPHKIIRVPLDDNELSLMITRWTSGYTFDFVKSQPKKSLAVPQKAAELDQPATNALKSAAHDEQHWSTKADEGSPQTIKSPEVTIPFNEISEPIDSDTHEQDLQDQTAESIAEDWSPGIASTNEFETMQLFVTSPPAANNDDDNQRYVQSIVDDVQADFGAVAAVPKLLLNDIEVEIDDAVLERRNSY